MTKDDALIEIRKVGERVKKLRASMPEDSPLHSVAFELSALLGKFEAELTSRKP